MNAWRKANAEMPLHREKRSANRAPQVAGAQSICLAFASQRLRICARNDSAANLAIAASGMVAVKPVYLTLFVALLESPSVWSREWPQAA
jgi:hypothetical protein